MTDPGPIECQSLWRADDGFRSSPTGKKIAENEDGDLRTLMDLEGWGEDSKDPHTWGYVLHHVGSIERYAPAIEKLDRWIRYIILQGRYAMVDPNDTEYQRLDLVRPTDSSLWPSEDLARRFKLDVVECSDEVVAGADVEDGDEDFMPVGAAFTEWVKENALNTSDLYVRNDHCLTIDEKSLVSFDALLSTTPDPGPTDLVSSDGGFMKSPHCDAWLWILDREYYSEVCDAEIPLPPYDYPDERRFEPWARIHVSDLVRLWFFRPKGMEPPQWSSCITRDREVFDKINWWEGVGSDTWNRLLRSYRR